MNTIAQLAPDEPLSPELVLVLSPELRAQALARLGPPVWSTRRFRVIEAPTTPEELSTPPEDAPPAPSLGMALVARVAQLGLIFAAVTVATLAMSLVAHAVR
jgi:hypothetical protein